MSNTILVPISHGTEEMEAVIVIDLLRRAGLKILVVCDTEIAACSRDVKILPDKMMSELYDHESFKAIIIPGGAIGVRRLSENKKFISLLSKHIQENRLVGAICAAPALLAENKLLPQGLNLTSHPSVKIQLLDYKYHDQAVVVDANFVTSQSAGTAIAFALTLIQLLKNPVTADKVAKEILLK
jgi:DJ-1 family protein